MQYSPALIAAPVRGLAASPAHVHLQNASKVKLGAPCVSALDSSADLYRALADYYMRAFLTIRGRAVTVVRVVVVQRAVRVDVAHVVRVAGVRRPQPPTDTDAYSVQLDAALFGC